MSGTGDTDEIRPPSSPVCYGDDPEANPLGVDEILALLNELLEGERAGAQGLVRLAERQTSPRLAELLRAVGRDEGRFCVMLNAEIRRLGGTPTTRTGVFLDKLLAREGLAAQLDLLDRGQSAVARMIHAALPRISDAALLRHLEEMYDVHVENIRLCAEVAAGLARGEAP
jgi:hypothetical protein